MASKGYILLGLLVLLGSFSYSNAATAMSPSYEISSFNRSSFPSDFYFGAASASYQYEGAVTEGGRKPSMWDYYSHKYPGMIADGSNGDVAIDQYHRYKEDIAILKDMGGNAYRFSIAWVRIIPTGKLSDGVNAEGVAYYNNLINELIAQGLTPFATIFHWDIPQTLEEEYGGFLSEKVLPDFTDFAEVCYKEFGDRVKHWITLNEPWTYSNGGYAQGMLAPFRCSSFYNPNCTGGDSAVEPYVVTHNLLLAHAQAVQVYKAKYQAAQKGVIGITHVCYWMEPYSNSAEDRNASYRALDFMCGWFMDPMITGDYPASMRSLVGSRLPTFTANQSAMIKGAYDFIGLNYYTANYVAYAPSYQYVNKTYMTDGLVNQTTSRNGVLIGPATGSSWLQIYPRGLQDLLNYFKNEYNDPEIYITENGVSEVNNSTLSLEESLVDNQRLEYYYGHLSYLNKSINGDGVKVKGYFAWSLMDNYEWNSGYTVRFGLYYIDYNNNLTRHAKLSANWFKNFLLS
ncbi:hypothetical protein I3843_13G145700 [Carya illinoinensis]|uniref:Beta-glucosidase n=1 Tax=Carya illinoinensis TaxID=32201 RepID=A0A8T1NSA8_CARIL|nr:beta-glucosidase 24-like [Carya illinoinensis]KAG2675046.1 hypothetical protein I3760_13G165900 [Carya illinoinensis]KAG6632551.1 hypothetical protein CIPAW_13G166900 [Carya illinoinensis]KAG6682911.1 hypothetical protein I3842_13G165800 [Carya illinoinensis]KAG7951025.1 hypothetical protein I3843_13G145700 [Carya illinoinensis]